MIGYTIFYAELMNFGNYNDTIKQDRQNLKNKLEWSCEKKEIF